MSDIKAPVERLDGLYGNATKGPWKVTSTYGTDILQAFTGNRRIARLYRNAVNPNHDIDSAFIVALVNSWPTIRRALSSLSEDAGRYRWLRDHAGGTFQLKVTTPTTDSEGEYEHTLFGKMAAEYLDKCIDAALSAGDEREGE